jgi:hypothetical protein
VTKHLFLPEDGSASALIPNGLGNILHDGVKRNFRPEQIMIEYIYLINPEFPMAISLASPGIVAFERPVHPLDAASPPTTEVRD